MHIGRRTLCSGGNTAYGWGNSATKGYLSTATSAGGDLTGTYPNPTIANNAVNSNKIENGSILGADLNQMSATSGQYLKWNGTTWLPGNETDPVYSASPAAGITNTQIGNWNTAYGWGNHSVAGYLSNGSTAGGDLTGTYPNPTLADGAVQGDDIDQMGASDGNVLAWSSSNSRWQPLSGGSSGAENINELADGISDASNVFLGAGSGVNDDGDNRNTGVGINSLNANTSGFDNSAFGFSALHSNSSGQYNTASGSYALYTNTAGLYNTANGYRALYSNTNGTHNTANGVASLYSNTTGFNNVANGSTALYYNISGYYNTANGSMALNNNQTGSSNTSNGCQSLFSNTKVYLVIVFL